MAYIPSWGQGLSSPTTDASDSMMPSIDTALSDKTLQALGGTEVPELNFEDSGGMGFLDKYNKKTGETTQGWGMPVIQGIGGLANAYLGYQQLQLGKSQLEQNKKIFNLNFGNQAQTLNTQMEDRQRARVASGEKVDSVDAYMSKHAIKTKGI